MFEDDPETGDERQHGKWPESASKTGGVKEAATDRKDSSASLDSMQTASTATTLAMPGDPGLQLPEDMSEKDRAELLITLEKIQKLELLNAEHLNRDQVWFWLSAML